MADLTEERTRLLVKISRLYYVDGLNQQEIASRLGVSRPQVSRMLSTARAEGIVQITIKDPYSEEHHYERAIAETFGIHDVIVLNVPGTDPVITNLHLARAGAALLETVLNDHDIVGVMAGRTIAAVGNEIGYFSRKGLQFVPLVGGWGSEGAPWHANSNARVLAEKLKSKYWILNAPAIVASAQARDVLAKEPEIAEVLHLARHSTVALVGIGQVSERATVVQSGYFSRENIEAVKRLGAVANLCTSFLDAQGNVVAYSDEERMIGLSAQELRQIPNVIAIADGEEKVPAITACLRGRWIDVLITDLTTAKQVLEWHHRHPLS
ncbi:MAG: sugar-binding transcriptional regulator [Hydrogenibacillus sp.]|nr:sugar-binding transcriptional regulator [Hydrogenibacillus sp.]